MVRFRGLDPWAGGGGGGRWGGTLQYEKDGNVRRKIGIIPQKGDHLRRALKNGGFFFAAGPRHIG